MYIWHEQCERYKKKKYTMKFTGDYYCVSRPILPPHFILTTAIVYNYINFFCTFCCRCVTFSGDCCCCWCSFFFTSFAMAYVYHSLGWLTMVYVPLNCKHSVYGVPVVGSVAIGAVLLFSNS